MAGLNIDLKKEISLGGGKTRGKMPTKTSINLVVKKETFLSSKKALPTIIGGIIVLCLLVGLLVIRPLVSLTRANSQISTLQSQIEETNKSMGDLEYIEEEYAHYTTDGMTEEEVSRVDRVKVMKLVEDAVLNSGVVKGWNLSENMMTLEVSGASLAELNQIASALEQKEIVERCVINTANRGAGTAEGGSVDVTFVVYLVPAEGYEPSKVVTAPAADDKGDKKADTEEGSEQ